MGKIKIHEIAKKLGLASKEVLEAANNLKIEAKSHLSGVSEEEAKKIEKVLTSKNMKKQGKERKEEVEKSTKKKSTENEKAPVIIRREVIIEEENEKKKDNNKKEEKKSNVGFVERKQNKDYNIVYRNKPNKPMTVSELFGLKKLSQNQKKNLKKKLKKKRLKRLKKLKQLKQKQKQNLYLKQQKEKKINQLITSKEKEIQIEQIICNKETKILTIITEITIIDSIIEIIMADIIMVIIDLIIETTIQQIEFNKRPLDAKGIEKNIKNIMSVETVEKENVREYNRGLDKQKNNNKFNENKNTKKSKSRRNNNESDFDEGKLKNLKQTNKLSNMFDDQDGGMLDYYDLTTQRGRRGKKKNNKNQGERTKQKIFQLTKIEIPESITVKDLAAEMKKTTADVIKKLLGYGIMATINQEVDFDTAYLVAQEFGITASKKEVVSEEDILFDDSEDKEEELEVRPPVIVVMGHVDHGKTSLLDTIRKTNVIEGEAGGITQAIGAYKVKVKDREITFLDTPGHEAFTAMRARGAQITDIAILVVAANDGVKPQTVEAINHAKSAGIPIIVAINKIDLPDSNIEKVKQELMAYDLVPEEWGGDTIFVPISAKKGENIDQLLEMVLLEADVLELKANPRKQAKGAVIEARLDKAKGAIATMLVQRGSLDVGDTIVVGSSIGRIRAMKNDKGKVVKSAGPSTPVEIMGLTEVPQAGDTFYEVKNEKMAKHLIERRKRQEREKALNATTKVTLDNLFSQMEEGNLKVLNLIVKADVQGSVEAVKQALEKLSNEEVRGKSYTCCNRSCKSIRCNTCKSIKCNYYCI